MNKEVVREMPLNITSRNWNT